MVLEGTPTEVAFAKEVRQPLTEAEFHRLYQSASADLWRYIARMTGDASGADDIFQKTFFRFLRGNPEAGDPTHARALLYHIATNLVIDEWRREKRERNRLTAELRQRRESDADVGRDVRRLLGLMKPQERALLWMAHVEEMTHVEIAERLGVAGKSVRVLLFRARKRFAALLQKHGLAQEVPA